MFTGLIEETGTVAAIGPRGERVDFVICSRMVHDVDAPGDSIVGGGICLTAVAP